MEQREQNVNLEKKLIKVEIFYLKILGPSLLHNQTPCLPKS